MTEHAHRFQPEEWKFACAADTLSYCTQKVLDPAYFIEEVYRDHDGDWQIFHNRGEADSPPKLFCLGCVCDFDPSVMQLHDLAPGWFA